MRKCMVSLATLLLLFAATVVSAENRAETFSLTPFAGGYTFDGKQHLDTSPVIGLRAGYNFTDRFGVEGLFDYTRSEGPLDDQKINLSNYSMNMLYHFCPKNRLVPFLTAGYGGMTFDPRGGSAFTKGAFNYGAGVKYALGKSMELRGEVRHLIFETTESLSNVEYGIGLGFLFGGKAAPVPVPPPAPPAPAPTSSLSVTPGSITTGETATLNWTSQNTTNCDITPGIGPVNTQGSMTIKPLADTAYSLSCNGPGGTTNSAANISVAAPQIAPPPPLVPTSSLSATPRSITQGGSATLNWTSENATNCDIQPGIGPVKPRGTMTVSPAADTAYTLTCTGSGGTTSSAASIGVVAPPKPEPPSEMLCYKIDIEFDTAKWNIKPQYDNELAKLAAFMKEYPNLTGVIEGHTDNVGGKEYNLKLSDKRAKSVRDYLVTKLGIDGSRLTAKGFGFSKPAGDNKAAAGRQTNRRVVANFACVEKKRKQK
jgi:OmpA-OmpF porin, OOP family